MDAAEDAPVLRWRCVACRSENQMPFGGPGKDVPREGRSTACAHCRTRHILAPGPDGIRHIAPLDEVGGRATDGRYRAGLVVLLLAASAAALLYVPAPAAGGAATSVGLGLVVLVSLWLLLRAGGGALAHGLRCEASRRSQRTQRGSVSRVHGSLCSRWPLWRRRSRGADGFRTLERGLEVRGADGKVRALIPWEKIHAAEYRLLLGRRMTLWLAIEGQDGTVPPAPLLAETGVALFTRSRAMPQFLLSLAGRLGERAPFLLPILTVNCGCDGRDEDRARGGVARALCSGAAPELVKGALSDEALARSLAEPGAEPGRTS